MITIALESGFELYLVFMLVMFLLVAAYDFWHQQAHGWTVSEERLCRCPGCSRTFIVRREETVARCPRCRRLCNVPKKA